MNRIGELCEKNAFVAGQASAVETLMRSILQNCGRDIPTVVLCRDESFARICAGEDDRIIVLGKKRSRGERLPDLFEPFLSHGEIGSDLDSIVEALSVRLMDKPSLRDGNDAYWSGCAERLFREILRSCLAGMKLEEDFSTAAFSRLYREIRRQLPLMVGNDPIDKKSPYSFPEESWALPFTGADQPHPLSELLVNVHPSTAQITTNNFYSNTGTLNELLRFMPEDRDMFFNFRETLEECGGGFLYLPLARSMESCSSSLLRFILGSLGVLASGAADMPLRIVIPDVAPWGDMSGLRVLLEQGRGNLSVIWGASNLSMFQFTSSMPERAVISMISLSGCRAWCRSGDVLMGDIYSRIVPQPQQLYALSGIPSGMVFLQSPQGDFEGMSLPQLPEAEWSPADGGEEEAAAGGADLWKDQPDDGLRSIRERYCTNMLYSSSLFDEPDMDMVPEDDLLDEELYGSGN